ncbi:MAG TPA: DNA polymerase III subunit beta, partial [Leptospiraceae bacterium]|nr:DNA polymerase III subunit beta [Leptospiraceae bacterium]
MKFSVKTSEIMKAIHNVEGIISSRDIKSLLSNIKIECAGDRISLSATDLEISIRSRVNATIEKEGTYCIPAKQLSNVIKVVNFTETRLETVQEEDTFQTFVTDAENKVDFKMSINGYEGEELKTITETSDRDLVDFPCFTLSSMLKKTFYSVAVEDTRYVFNGIYLKSTDNKITAVGTDGRRLAKLEREVPNKLPFTKGVIVPHKAIREILKLIESASDGKIGLIENQIYVSVNENALQCKLIDGAYPDYESVIPKESKYKVLYEAACCGSIPIIRCLEEYYSGESIRNLSGIINGSTNFMLNRVDETGSAIESVIEEAVQLGFAESDPSLDTEAWDAWYKLNILLAHLSGRVAEASEVLRCGI